MCKDVWFLLQNIGMERMKGNQSPASQPARVKIKRKEEKKRRDEMMQTGGPAGKKRFFMLCYQYCCSCKSKQSKPLRHRRRPPRILCEHAASRYTRFVHSIQGGWPQKILGVGPAMGGARPVHWTRTRVTRRGPLGLTGLQPCDLGTPLRSGRLRFGLVPGYSTISVASRIFVSALFFFLPKMYFTSSSRFVLL